MKRLLAIAAAVIGSPLAGAAPVVAPYGSWASPISIDSITAATRIVTDVLVEGADIVLLEERSDEEGRTAAVLREADGRETTLTPAGFNVNTRVHEYGGGAALVSGGVLYFSNKRDGRLYAQALRGGAPQALTPEGVYRYADCAMDRPRAQLVCVREDHTGGRPSAVRNTLVGVPLAGSSAGVLLFEGTDFVARPQLSRDGRSLAFVAWNHPNMPWDATSLRVASIAAGKLDKVQTVVDATRGASVMQPSWSPDGTLYFISDETGWWNLWRWKGGTAESVAPLEAEIGGPMWRFGRRDYLVLDDDRLVVSITEAGVSRLAVLTPSTRQYTPIDLPYVSFDSLTANGPQVYAIGASRERPAEVIALDASLRSATVLRKNPATALPGSMVSKAESMTFDNREGKRVQAFYYPPRNPGYAATKGEKPPVLVLAHGGPTSARSPAYRQELQFWTTRGFAVLDINYSGSTGFGTAYRKRLNGRWGEIDVNDVVDAAKAAAARGLVDPKRSVVKGGSAGGFVVLAALAFQKEVFAAGINYFGVSDMAVLARDTHKFESRYLDTLVGPLPQAEAIYAKRSPLSAVDNIRAPLLTLQGLEDKIVPPQQSAAIMARVEANGVPAAYLAFDGEGHGFRGAKAKQQSLQAELSFLGQVLGFTPADSVPRLKLRNMDPHDKALQDKEQ